MKKRCNIIKTIDKDSGFTLIEVMIAIAIFGIASLTVVQLMMKSIEMNSSAESMIGASMSAAGMAESLMVEELESLANGSSANETFDTGLRSFTTTYSVSDMPIAGGDPDDVYKMITVTTTWQEGTRTRSITSNVLKIK